MDIGSRLLLASSTNKSPEIPGEPIPASWSYIDDLSGWFSSWGSKYESTSVANAECTVKRIKYANGIYMALSGSGRIATSSDNGQTWVYKPAARQRWKLNAASYTPIHLEYGNGMWIVMEVYGRYMYSTDNGNTWTYHASPGTGFAQNLMYGEKWLRAGDAGVLYYSTDGLNWTTTYVGEAEGGQFSTFGLWRCVWSPGLQKYVAVASGGKSAVSTNGINWTISSQLGTTNWGTATSFIMGAAPVNSIGYNTRVFIHSYSPTLTLYAYSDDGLNWSSYYDKGYTPFDSAARIEHNIYGWMYPQAGTTSPNRATLSADANFGWFDAGSSGLIRPFPYHGYSGQITAIGPNQLPAPNINTLHGSTAGIITTDDGVTYNDSLSKYYSKYGFESGSWERVFKSSEGYYVVYRNRSKIATSVDGVTWTLMQTPSNMVNTFFQLILDKNPVTGKFIAFGTSGQIYHSSDLANWTQIANLGYTATYGLLAGNRYIVGTTSGYILYSDDNGLNWIVSSSLTSTSWGASEITWMAWNGTVVMISGQSGKIATSIDGINWTIATNAGTVYGYLATDGNRFVKVTTNSSYITEDNGQTWTTNSSVFSSAIFDIQYVQRLKKFVACGYDLAVYYSSDGQNWTKSPVSTSVGTSTVTHVCDTRLTSSADGRVFVGYNGTCIVGSN